MNGESTIALVDWSQLIEDYLDNIGVSFESFCNEMSGGWMFGYIDELKLAGVRTVLFCVSAKTRKPISFRHRATGATICMLPAPAIYRSLRRRLLNPYAATVEEAVGDVRGARRAFWTAVKEIAPYLSSPPIHLWRELRREKCKLILCQEYEHGRFDICLALGRLMRLPVFGTFQGGSQSLGYVEKLLRRSALMASVGLIIPTHGEGERVERCYGIAGEKVAAVFNPVDLNEWVAEEKSEARAKLKIPAAARVAVWHGRIDFRRKGVDVLLRAWQRVCDERPGRDLRLLLIGSGNNSDELREQIAASKPRGLIWVDEYLNDRKRLRGYLSAADVYAFPSRHEGFAVAPLEAMSCQLPLVATDIPGMNELLGIGDESAGLTVPVGDAYAFAAALGRLLDDEAVSRRMGKNARSIVEERFSPGAIGTQLSTFLFPAHGVH